MPKLLKQTPGYAHESFYREGILGDKPTECPGNIPLVKGLYFLKGDEARSLGLWELSLFPATMV